MSHRSKSVSGEAFPNWDGKKLFQGRQNTRHISLPWFGGRLSQVGKV
ncbi:hypothetical protein [Chryseobacterium sp. JAH]|nr:hypothetical protein [Chryseobacterium sp. JAH]